MGAAGSASRALHALTPVPFTPTHSPRCLQEYLRLEASGALAWTLDELYNWGKAFGWEPVVWKGGKPHPQGPAPMPVPP